MRALRFSILLTFVLAAACSDGPTGSEQLSVSELQQLTRVQAAEEQRVAMVAAESELALDSLRVQFSLVGTLGDLTRQVTGLLYCEPQPYVATVQIMGPEGGVIRVGQHSLVIPRGALTQRTVITAERPVSLAATVRFSPHGLRFQRSAGLTMDYSHCDGLLFLRKRIAYTDEKLNILEWPFSFDDATNEQVQGKIDHFSRYAVAY